MSQYYSRQLGSVYIFMECAVGLEANQDGYYIDYMKATL